MAKYDKTMFFWLQLKEDFFDEEAISWLEEQPNGKEYCLFYLKLCLKSLKTNGIMIRQVGQIYVPYDANKLAEITRTDVDTVVVALELLKQIGLIKILKNGEIYLPNVENMIGSKSVGAFKKEQQRYIRVDKCPPLVHQSVHQDYRYIDYRNINNISLSNNINNILSTHVRACACEEEIQTYLQEHFKSYFQYWGYDEQDKQTFNEVMKVLANAIEKSKTNSLNYYHTKYKTKYNFNLFVDTISVLDDEDIHKIVFQILNNNDIQNRYLYILGAVLTRANEKIEQREVKNET